jgi:RimJ/RimL family protein N-acetyltransferase
MLKYKETKIRPLSLDDLDNIMTWVNDPEVVGRYAYFTKPFTREQEAEWLEQKINSKTDFFYAVENAEGIYLGNCGIEKIHWPAKHGRLSITIGNKKERGKGHGFRTVNLLLDRAFNEHGLHKIFLIVTIGNQRGVNLFKKCGFVEEGTLKDHYVIEGKFVDMYMMRILDEDFKEIHKLE